MKYKNLRRVLLVARMNKAKNYIIIIIVIIIINHSLQRGELSGNYVKGKKEKEACSAGIIIIIMQEN